MRSQFLLALSVVILDEVLQQVHSLLGLDLVDFDQILMDTKTQSCRSCSCQSNLPTKKSLPSKSSKSKSRLKSLETSLEPNRKTFKESLKSFKTNLKSHLKSCETSLMTVPSRPVQVQSWVRY